MIVPSKSKNNCCFMSSPLFLIIGKKGLSRKRFFFETFDKSTDLLVPQNSFNFCFDGLPKFATLSISTIGVKRDSNAMKIWQAGVKEMLKRLQPMRLIVYGGKIEFDYGDTEVIYIENAVTE
ncbi:MAG: DUF4417 domain-containing protein, partial [Enterococcus gallinarum]|nr:DUF4417 domain-containing protein [Enterococcus gallinarum]